MSRMKVCPDAEVISMHGVLPPYFVISGRHRGIEPRAPQNLTLIAMIVLGVVLRFTAFVLERLGERVRFKTESFMTAAQDISLCVYSFLIATY